MTRRELYAECSALMADSAVEDAQFDAMCIFQDVLGDRHPLFRPLEEVPGGMEELIRSLVRKRCGGYPLQYLLGQWEFYGYPFAVGEGVLIPRPETETLVEQVIELCRRQGLRSPRIADLCSGSGCIAIALKKQIPSAEVWALEYSPEAMRFLRENKRLNSADVHELLCSVTDTASAADFRELDIIVSNPPYLTPLEMAELQREVAYEPAMALAGGADGLDFYRAITALWRDSLKSGGWLFFESGDAQAESIEKILAGNGFEDMTLTPDCGGILRVVCGRKTGG